MGGYYWWIFGFKNHHIDHTTLHEVLHTYEADHVLSSGYIMSETGSANVMHYNTYSSVDASRYDEWSG